MQTCMDRPTIVVGIIRGVAGRAPSGGSKMTFFSQIDFSFSCFLTVTSWVVSFLYLFLHVLARTLGTFGVCGVKVFNWNLFRQKLKYTRTIFEKQMISIPKNNITYCSWCFFPERKILHHIFFDHGIHRDALIIFDSENETPTIAQWKWIRIRKALRFLRRIVNTTTLSAHFQFPNRIPKIFCIWDPNHYRTVKVDLDTYSKNPNFHASNGQGYLSLSSFRICDCIPRGWGCKSHPEITWKWWRHIWKGMTCLRQMLYAATLFWNAETWLVTFEETELTVGLLRWR